MDVFASECNSGCESGWTLYLEQSFLSPNPSHKQSGFVDGRGFYSEEHHKEKRGKHEDDEEEDLSMVSDASSGPPHFHEDDDYFNDNNGCSYPASMDAAFLKNSGKRQKTKELKRPEEEQIHPSLLDDTASSPLFNFSKNNFTLANNQAAMESMLDFSQGFSATHYENGSAFQSHLGILQSPLSGNQLQQNQWF